MLGYSITYSTGQIKKKKQKPVHEQSIKNHSFSKDNF